MHFKRILTVSIGLLLFAAFATTASATTLIMPVRHALKGTTFVAWGNTTQANGTAFSFDCGDGTAPTSGSVTDRSYINRTCNYANAGTFTVTLTVGAETATVVVTSDDPALLSAFDLRADKINIAIEDGLRYMYQAQFNRAAQFTTNLTSATPMTSWRDATPTDNWANSYTALTILAMQNHGHAVNEVNAATDIFQPVVQNGLNYLFNNLIQRNLQNPSTPGVCGEVHGAQTDNPCVNVPAPVNIGLSAPTNDGRDGYATPIFAAAIAAATAAQPGRTVLPGLGAANANFVAGKTYSEVLQRITNAVVWGQSDTGLGEGGWYYNLQAGSVSDGSVDGWGLLGLIDAGAAGATVPPFAPTEFAKVMVNQDNTNGSFDYQVDGNPASTNSTPGKTGIRLQGLAFTNVAAADARVTASLGYITRNWSANVDGFDYPCTAGTPTTWNKGCGYGMFNIFKGLRLYGVTTLPGIGRPAGPGSIAVDDWYADYVDNLLANQHNPSSPTSGEWGQNIAPFMGWSCCDSDINGITALAELILAPTAFVPPDPNLFSTVGLSPATATNPVGTSHTVTALAQTASLAPVPGATVNFAVLTGPNAGKTGSAVTNANGQATFTYSDTGGAGTDTIQASIGTLNSNIVSKAWTTDCGTLGFTAAANLATPMFPLDHGMRNVTISGVGANTITKICQDEDPNFENIPAYAVDGGGIGTSTAQVRAERSGTRTNPGNGRVYHIFFSAPANSCAGQVTVGVPLVAGGVAVDDGAIFNSVTGGACNQ